MFPKLALGDDNDVCLCLYDEAGISQCVHLNQTNKSANISVLATGYNGSFYSGNIAPVLLQQISVITLIVTITTVVCIRTQSYSLARLRMTRLK